MVSDTLTAMLRRFAFVAVVLAAACGGQIQADGNVATRTVGTEKGDPNDPTSGRDPVEDGGTLVVSPGESIGVTDACQGSTTPLRTDFESGNIADVFNVHEPSAFTIDATSPIDGAHSLAVDPDAEAYLAYKVAGSCSVLITFAVRLSTQTVASGTRLVAVSTGERSISLIVNPGGAVTLVQELATAEGSMSQPGNPFATLSDGVAMSVLLKVDIATQTAEANIVVDDGRDGGANAGSASQGFINGVGVASAGAVVEVDFGSAPDFLVKAPLPNGTYWLDDIAIE